MGCLLWHVESPRGRAGPGPLLALGLISRGWIRLQLRCGAPGPAGLAGGGQGGPGSQPCSGRAPARGVKVPTAPTAAGGTRGAAVRTQHIARRVLHQDGAAGRMTTVGGSGAGVHTGPALSPPTAGGREQQGGVRAAGPPCNSPSGPSAVSQSWKSSIVAERGQAPGTAGALVQRQGWKKIKRPFCRFLRGTKFVMGTCQCHVRGRSPPARSQDVRAALPATENEKAVERALPCIEACPTTGRCCGPPTRHPRQHPSPTQPLQVVGNAGR